VFKLVLRRPIPNKSPSIVKRDVTRLEEWKQTAKTQGLVSKPEITAPSSQLSSSAPPVKPAAKAVTAKLGPKKPSYATVVSSRESTPGNSPKSDALGFDLGRPPSPLDESAQENKEITVEHKKQRPKRNLTLNYGRGSGSSSSTHRVRPSRPSSIQPKSLNFQRIQHLLLSKYMVESGRKDFPASTTMVWQELQLAARTMSNPLHGKEKGDIYAVAIDRFRSLRSGVIKNSHLQRVTVTPEELHFEED